MTNRPHVFTIQSSDDRKLATVLVGQESVTGVRVEDGALQVHANDYGTFTRALAKQAKASDVRLTSVLPADESLEKVFSYLVAT